MNWMRSAIILLVIAVALPVTESAGNQDDPAVAAARKLFGDYRIIPSEQIGTVRLGEATRDDFRTRYGLTLTYGFQLASDVEWHWPERNFGRGPGGPWDQPFAFIFCQSNGRLMAAYVFNAGSWYPDHQMFWLFMRRLRTPEGLSGEVMISKWLTAYSEPRMVIREFRPNNTFYFFGNGLMIGGGTNQSVRPACIGVYNLDICRGGELPKGKYIPFFGHGEVKKFFLSKQGNPQRGVIGNPITSEAGGLPRFGMKELVYVGLELAFPAQTRERRIEIVKEFLSPEGLTGTGSPTPLELTIKPGQTSLFTVFVLGTQFKRAPGKWLLKVLVKDSVIATVEFEMVE